jgi:WD40 repeat protein
MTCSSIGGNGLLAVGDAGGMLHIYNPGPWPVVTIQAHTSAIRSLSFGPGDHCSRLVTSRFILIFQRLR